MCLAGEFLNAQLGGKVMVDICLPREWERVAQLRFAVGLSEPVCLDLYAELMGRCGFESCAPHYRILQLFFCVLNDRVGL